MLKKNRSHWLEEWGVRWLLACIIKLLEGFGEAANLWKRREMINLLFASIFWKGKLKQ